MNGIDLVSIGQAAMCLQLGVARIRRTAKKLGIEPWCRINGVDHYTEADIDRIREYLLAQSSLIGPLNTPMM